MQGDLARLHPIKTDVVALQIQVRDGLEHLGEELRDLSQELHELRGVIQRVDERRSVNVRDLYAKIDANAATVSMNKANLTTTRLAGWFSLAAVIIAGVLGWARPF